MVDDRTTWRQQALVAQDVLVQEITGLTAENNRLERDLAAAKVSLHDTKTALNTALASEEFLRQQLETVTKSALAIELNNAQMQLHNLAILGVDKRSSTPKHIYVYEKCLNPDCRRIQAMLKSEEESR